MNPQSWTFNRADYARERAQQIREAMNAHVRLNEMYAQRKAGLQGVTSSATSRPHTAASQPDRHREGKRTKAKGASKGTQLVDELSAATGHQSRDPRPGTASSSVVEHPYVFNRPSWMTPMETLPPDNRTYREHSKASRMYRNWLGCGLGHPAVPYAVRGRDTVATPPHLVSPVDTPTPDRPPRPRTPQVRPQSTQPSGRPASAAGSERSVSSSRFATQLLRESRSRPPTADATATETKTRPSATGPSTARTATPDAETDARSLVIMDKLRKALYHQQAAHMDCGARAQARERELFAAFDTLTAGTPGVLTPKEFEAAALRIMPELKPEQLRRLFKELDRDRDGFIDFLGFLQATVYGSSALTAELLQRALPERTSEKYLARANALTKRRTAHLLMKRGVDPVEEINESLLRKARQMEAGDDKLEAGMHVLWSQAGEIPAAPGGKLHRMFQYYDVQDRGLITSTAFRRAFDLLKLGVQSEHLSFAVKMLSTKEGKQDYVDYRKFMSFFSRSESVYRPTER